MEDERMKGVFALSLGAALMADTSGLASAQSAPAPQPTPLKQIIDVKSRPLCTALRDNIAIDLAGLIKNEQIIGEGRKAMNKIGSDQIKSGRQAIDQDELMIEDVVGSLVRNIVVLDKVLDDPKRFPTNPTTDDERLADRIKKQLQAVEDDQKLQLNWFNGTIETDRMSTMQQLPANAPAANPSTASSSSAATSPTSSPGIADAGLKDAPNTPSISDPRTLAAGDIIGTTYYGQVANSIGTQQQLTAAHQDAAAASIREAVAICAPPAPQTP
jgi:hypothetical protein